MTVTLYGISNCDTVKKARAWLTEHGVAHTFHDYKKNGVDGARLKRWTAAVGWEKLLNRGGTTFRRLPEADKVNLDEGKAVKLLLQQPSLIRRPVVEHPGGLLVGFAASEFARLCGQASTR